MDWLGPTNANQFDYSTHSKQLYSYTVIKQKMLTAQNAPEKIENPYKSDESMTIDWHSICK